MSSIFDFDSSSGDRYGDSRKISGVELVDINSLDANLWILVTHVADGYRPNGSDSVTINEFREWVGAADYTEMIVRGHTQHYVGVEDSASHEKFNKELMRRHRSSKSVSAAPVEGVPSGAVYRSRCGLLVMDRAISRHNSACNVCKGEPSDVPAKALAADNYYSYGAKNVRPAHWKNSEYFLVRHSSTHQTREMRQFFLREAASGKWEWCATGERSTFIAVNSYDDVLELGRHVDAWPGMFNVNKLGNAPRKIITAPCGFIMTPQVWSHHHACSKCRQIKAGQTQANLMLPESEAELETVKDAEPDNPPTVLTDKLVRPAPEVRPAPSPRDSQLEDALSSQITDLLDQMKSASPSGVVILAQAVDILVKQKDLIEKADRLTDQIEGGLK